MRFVCDAIGTLESCFKQRNGTPRQSMLVKSALSRLAVASSIDRSALAGLADYSHCIVLFVFHANTNFHKTRGARCDQPEPDEAGVRHLVASLDHSCKAKVSPPRMHGGSTGVFATRSPHHPIPIGISIGRIESVDERRGVIHFSGLDLVDGTPVLDIKPYVPHDIVPLDELRVPGWVAAPDELYSVVFEPEAARQVVELFNSAKEKSLFSNATRLTEFVSEALARDIRSVFRQQQQQKQEHRVLLDVMLFTFTVDSKARTVTVTNAQLPPPNS